jgi:hypothetical protein
MAIVPNSQSFAAGASGTTITGLASQFRAAMDSVLYAGRDVTVHLPPSKQQCPTGCRFNQAYNKFIGTNGQPCRQCGGDGFLLEPRQTIYRANIRWISDKFDQSINGGQLTIGGRVFVADVRTKMDAVAHNHILESIGATIDGIPVKLATDPELTGFGGQVNYVVAYWQKANRKVER